MHHAPLPLQLSDHLRGCRSLEFIPNSTIRILSYRSNRQFIALSRELAGSVRHSPLQWHGNGRSAEHIRQPSECPAAMIFYKSANILRSLSVGKLRYPPLPCHPIDQQTGSEAYRHFL